MDQRLWEQFVDLACALSPENLSCDGELPQAQVRKRYQGYMKEWRGLEALAGRKVTEEEVWDYQVKKVKAMEAKRVQGVIDQAIAQKLI